MAVGCHSWDALVATNHHQVMVPIVFPRVFRRPMTFLRIWQSSLLRWKRYEECKQIKQISMTFYCNKKHIAIKQISSTYSCRIRRFGWSRLVNKNHSDSKGDPAFEIPWSCGRKPPKSWNRPKQWSNLLNKGTNSAGIIQIFGTQKRLEVCFFFFGSENGLFGLGEILGSSRSFSGALYDLSRMP